VGIPFSSAEWGLGYIGTGANVLLGAAGAQTLGAVSSDTPRLRGGGTGAVERMYGEGTEKGKRR